MIKNFSKLGTTKKRKDTLKIIEAGIKAVQTKKVLKETVKRKGETLYVKNKKIKLKNVYVVGAGKASGEMAKYLHKILGKKIVKGIVVSTTKAEHGKIKVVKGGHPIPNKKGAKAAKQILELVKELGKEDLIINLVSGGGSALSTTEDAVSLNEKKRINEQLIKSGAKINEINSVRKHIDNYKGGKLAKAAYPAKIISLIFSDVVGDDLSTIASGPTIKDKSTSEQAIKILKKYKIKVNKKTIKYIKENETPKEKKYFKNISNILLLTNKPALEAMKKEAKKRGYNVRVLSDKIKEDVEIVARKFKGNTIAAGEPTVHVTGKGKGGRAMELAIRVAMHQKKPFVFVAAGTDGRDGPTDADGAIVDETTDLREAKKYLKRNDSYNFFKKNNGLIKTGPTGTNVGDLMIMLSVISFT